MWAGVMLVVSTMGCQFSRAHTQQQFIGKSVACSHHSLHVTYFMHSGDSHSHAGICNAFCCRRMVSCPIAMFVICLCMPNAVTHTGGILDTADMCTTRACQPLLWVGAKTQGRVQVQPQEEGHTVGQQHRKDQLLVPVIGAFPTDVCLLPFPTFRSLFRPHPPAQVQEHPQTGPQSGLRGAAVHAMAPRIAAMPGTAAEMCHMGHVTQHSVATHHPQGHPGPLVGLQGTALCAAQVGMLHLPDQRI